MKRLNQTVVSFDGIKISTAEHLPLVAAFLDRMGISRVVNTCVPTEMAVDIGSVVKLMVVDTLSGRSPLYRLEEFARSVDTGLLLGSEVDPGSFNDTTLGRALDAIYAYGTEKLFSQVALSAASSFSLDVDTRHVHFDTTSVSVWGDYAISPDSFPGELCVTYGHSKDNRPDLKQFLIKMLCIHRNIPILGGCASGNASDKAVNNTILMDLSSYMAKHGIREGAFIYIADSAFVTPSNLEAIGNNLFISRLPHTYAETDRAIARAVEKGEWTDVKRELDQKGGRKLARYRVCEKSVTISGKDYRAVVVHSDAHDARRLKKIDREVSDSFVEAGELLKDARKTAYYCSEDAQAQADKLRSMGPRLHYCDCTVKEKVTYSRGRPPKNGERRVSKTRYALEGKIVEKTGEIAKLREAAGCFVLLTNVPAEGEMAHTPEEILAAYKEQHGIERNFGFLKDPVFVNDIFLKRPDRIEVLGFILLCSLLAWSLMEHVMRGYLKRNDCTITGWNKRPTKKPTTFMMTTKFKGVLAARIDGEWYFTAPLSEVQREYVSALGLTEEMVLGRGGKGEELRYRKLPGEKR